MIFTLTNLQKKAAAAVSGLAAYFISLSQKGIIKEDISNGRRLKKYLVLRAQSWVEDSTIRFIYNGITFDDAGVPMLGPSLWDPSGEPDVS